MQALPSAFARRCRARHACGCPLLDGEVDDGVVPPMAAARVPVRKSSAETVPPKGISMWVWASMPPGARRVR